MGRPEIYTDDAQVRVSAHGTSRLQRGSDRRAIVDALIDRGGKMSLRELDEHFGISMRRKAIALVRVGWLELEE